jgi:hypothetical protein
MTNLNGDSTFAQSDLTIAAVAPTHGKRKRSESADELSSNAALGGPKQLKDFSQRLQNALSLLRKYGVDQTCCYAKVDRPIRADPAPSVLNHPLSLNGERSPKRPRYSSENVEAECINSRIESGYYDSPEALLADVDAAVTSLTQGLQSGDNAINDPDSARRAVDQVNLFKQSLSKVCWHIADSDAKVKEENGVSGVLLPGIVEVIPSPAVLTLTSQTERGPKPLFSGLQRQNHDPPTGADISDSKYPDGLPTLDPGSFPNGIAVTEVPPSNVLDQADSAKQKRTFSEVFRPHRSLKALEPPRPSRNATRGSSLGWVNHEELAGSERPTLAYKSDYRYASLPTGSWLHYNGAEGSAAWASDSKRRQKDRALSFGESRPEAPEETVEHEQAKTRALFQSAYSSFAPSFDNSAAVVSEKTRSHAWWNKFGQKRFQALLALQYPESDLDRPGSALETIDHAEDDFEAMIADFEEDTLEDPLQDHTKNFADPKDIDEVLQEVSDLLQTLSSYQRIRNLSKMSNGPATPTSSETDVYEILRSNLSILVNSMPPYAVAKLSGEQLEALNVSTNIVVDMKDHVGTMAVDEYSLQRQRASMAATHPTTARASVSTVAPGRPGNYTAQSVNYNQRQSSSSTPRTPYGNQPRAPAAYGNTGTPHGQSYPAARPTPMSSQRASFPTQQHHSNQTYSQAPNTAQFQRSSSTLQNGYGSSYAQNVHSQAYPQPRQGQSSYSYPPNQSPQRPVQTPQSVPNAQHQYMQHQALQKPPISSSVAYAMNNQIAMTDQARAQLQAHRQLSGTPQTPNINGQHASMARSSTPGGGAPNGRPAVAASSGGQ